MARVPERKGKDRIGTKINGPYNALQYAWGSGRGGERFAAALSKIFRILL
jgi:hypothetical protein